MMLSLFLIHKRSLNSFTVSKMFDYRTIIAYQRISFKENLFSLDIYDIFYALEGQK